jgi:methionine sulfoxide reductase heme-binding subunit
MAAVLSSPASSGLRAWLTPAWITRWKAVLFVLALVPFALLVYRTFTQDLGANPQETIIRFTGEWTLIALCVTLAITPLHRLTGRAEFVRFRRMLGLFAFFYCVLHMLAYAGFDMGFDVREIVRDIIKRPFILVGSLALVLMLPLALTSFNRAIKFVGAKRWQMLHKAVYVVIALGVLHFWWMRAAKGNLDRPAVYAAIVLLLLGFRVVYWLRQRKA